MRGGLWLDEPGADGAAGEFEAVFEAELLPGAYASDNTFGLCAATHGSKR